jgi:hypothetical protein
MPDKGRKTNPSRHVRAWWVETGVEHHGAVLSTPQNVQFSDAE